MWSLMRYDYISKLSSQAEISEEKIQKWAQNFITNSEQEKHYIYLKD